MTIPSSTNNSNKISVTDHLKSDDGDCFSTSDISDRITFRLHTASRLVQQLSQNKLKQFDLTQAQWRALSGICTQPGTTLQQLTAFAQISQPLMSQAVKALEARQLIVRKTPKTDKRSSVLSANKEGIAIYKLAYQAMMEVEQEILQILGEQSDIQLKSLLDNVITGLNNTGR